MGKKKVNNKTRSEIVYAITNYINNRLVDNQRIISLRKENSREKFITLDEYVYLFINYKNKIRELEDLLDEENKLYFVVKKSEVNISPSEEGISFLNSFGISRLNEEFTLVDESYKNILPVIRLQDAISILLNNLKSTESKNVELTFENIQDIIKLINYYLNNFDYPECKGFDEQGFIIYALEAIVKEDKNKNLVKLAKKYLIYFKSRDGLFFEKQFIGSIDFGFSSLVHIINNENRELFKINEEHDIETPYNKADDYIIFADNIMFGAIMEDGEILELPFRVINDEENIVYHSLLHDNRYYYETNELSDNEVRPTVSLKTYLNYYGLDSLYRSVYTFEELKDVVNILKKVANITNTNIYERQASMASDWWMSVIDGENATKDELIKFKNLLKSKIISGLINEGYIKISNEYDSRMILAKCANSLGISIVFPWRVTMLVTNNEIIVNDGYEKKLINSGK